MEAQTDGKMACDGNKMLLDSEVIEFDENNTSDDMAWEMNDRARGHCPEAYEE